MKKLEVRGKRFLKTISISRSKRANHPKLLKIAVQAERIAQTIARLKTCYLRSNKGKVQTPSKGSFICAKLQTAMLGPSTVTASLNLLRVTTCTTSDKNLEQMVMA